MDAEEIGAEIDAYPLPRISHTVSTPLQLFFKHHFYTRAIDQVQARQIVRIVLCCW